MGCEVEKRELTKSILEVCLNEKDIADVITPTQFANLSIVPANQDLTIAEVEMQSFKNSPFILKEQLEKLEKTGKVDTVIIDCPPA